MHKFLPSQRYMGYTKAAIRPPEKENQKKVATEEGEGSYLSPTFKRATENLLCLQYLNGFYVRCDQFTNASCNPPVLPN